MYACVRHSKLFLQTAEQQISMEIFVCFAFNRLSLDGSDSRLDPVSNTGKFWDSIRLTVITVTIHISLKHILEHEKLHTYTYNTNFNNSTESFQILLRKSPNF